VDPGDGSCGDDQIAGGGFMSLIRNSALMEKSGQHPSAVEAVLNYLARSDSIPMPLRR
jgi:hypothetical protein